MDPSVAYLGKRLGIWRGDFPDVRSLAFWTACDATDHALLLRVVGDFFHTSFVIAFTDTNPES